MLGILHRTDHGNSAQQLVLESQFESLDADTLQAVLDGFENLETATLRLGLEHRNAQIRLKTLRVLLRRGSLNHEMAERLSKDSDASIRHEAVTALEKLGRSFTEEEVKKVLVRPGKQSSSGLLGSRLSDSDWKGKELFERYRLESLMKRPESELIRKVEGGFMYDDAAYFARAEKYFAKHAEELRRDIDDAFNAYYKERIRRTKATFGGLSADLVGSHNDLNDFHRKRLTRQGLDILCRAGNREDLQRVRGNLQSGYAGTSKADVEYLGKHGGWEDISLIANADIPNFGGNLLEQESHEDFRNQVAKVVIDLGHGLPVSELFALEMPTTILKRTISLCAESRFSQISNDFLLSLLHHESEDVRKSASIKAILAFPADRIKLILDEYLGSDSYYSILRTEFRPPCQ